MIDSIMRIDISTEYCILVDAKVDDVIQIAKKYPKAFIFTFDCTPLDRISEIIDYTPLHPDSSGNGYEDWMERLVQRLYIGNYPENQHNEIISGFVENSMRGFPIKKVFDNRECKSANCSGGV